VKFVLRTLAVPLLRAATVSACGSLDRDSVANVSQLATIDREFLRNHSGRLPPSKIQAILRGVDIMLGR
jgi:mRNA-degrading endonuclease toxin of MazEF toxin-antitoxin module